MTSMKRVLSLLLAVLMVAGLILVPVSAEGEGETDYAAMGAMNVAYAGGKTENVSGLEMSKTFTQTGPDTGVLTLEVYSTGSRVTTTVQKEVPTDIVLVLDQSGSMADCIYCGKSKSGNFHNHSAYTAVTTVSTSKSYYILSGGSYQSVTYCSGTHSGSGCGGGSSSSCAGGAGWYTSTDAYYHTSANRITPKTTDTPDGTQFYEATTVGFTSRLDSLKSAVKDFTDAVAEKAKGADGEFGTADDINHRIAVVGFASDETHSNNEYLNTELFIGSTQYQYAQVTTGSWGSTTTTYPAEAYYSQAFQNMNTQAGYNNVIASKDALAASGATAIDLGTEMANKIFEAYKADYEKDSDRAKIVVVFTDGAPGFNASTTDETRTAYAEKAINNTYKSQNTYGAKVYTVGVFDDADSSTPGTLTDSSDWGYTNGSGSSMTFTAYADVVNKFMHLMSSDYPNAKGMDKANYGKMNSTTGYYMAANDAEALTNIFQTISNTIDNESTSTELSSDTILQDVVSGYFDIDIPEGQTAAEAITVQKVGYAGNGLWDTPEDLTTGVTVNGNQIQVTGFDYKNEWVGLDNGNPHGSKLVLTIPVKENGTGFGDNLPTNGENSAILPGGSAENAIPFQCPLVNLPYFTVVHVQSRVDTTTGKNYGQKVSTDEVNRYRVYGNTPFDLTLVVNKDNRGNTITTPDANKDRGNDYLYGGAFTDEPCTNPMTTPGTAITPENGGIYYIWEVPARYLDPASYDVWGNADGLMKHYMLVNVDRLNYAKVGFEVTGFENDTLNDVYTSGSDNFAGGLYNKSDNTDALYGCIQVSKLGQPYDMGYLNDGKYTFTKGSADPFTVSYQDEGFIGGYRLDTQMFAALKSGDDFTFQPYWITPDGVKVTGYYSLTSGYTAGSKAQKTTPTWNDTTPTVEAVSDAVSGQSMMLMAVYAMDDQQEEILTLTIHDGDKTYELTTVAGGSIRSQLSYAAPADQLFAGWFSDEACTIPAQLDDITESGDVYAKYVSDGYLSLKYNKQGLFRLSGVSLVSAVDNVDNYAETGILVNGEPVSVTYSTRYRLIYTAGSLFDGVARRAPLMTAQLSLSGSGTLEVTPYWVTLDGTTVLGQTRVLTYDARSIRG